MRTAVVILNWNGAAMMRRFLPTVIAYSKDDADVIVADNGSTDDSLAMLKSEFPSVRIIVLDKNYGFAEGYNKALAAVNTEFVVLLNSDVEVTKGWLKPLISFMDEHQECAACQPKLLSERERGSFEYAGASGGFLDRYGYPFCRGRLLSTVEQDRGQYDHPLEVLWATGACLFIRNKDYKWSGGLDGRFFAHNEEIDLCWRLRIRGRHIYCVPQSSVYHVGGGTLPQGNPRKTYLNFRNNLTMLYKNLPEGELQRVMRVRQVLDYVAALQMIVSERSLGGFKAVVKARRDFYRWLPQFEADRKAIQESWEKSETQPGRAILLPQIYGRSILWQYYVKGKHCFADLKWL